MSGSATRVGDASSVPITLGNLSFGKRDNFDEMAEVS